MKKLILASTIALCLSNTLVPSVEAKYSEDPEQRKQEKQNESIGFGSGAVAGALVGGPVGAFVGGIFGVLIADDINSDNQLAQKESDLVDANNKLAMTNASVEELELALAQAKQQQMLQLASFQDADHLAKLDELSKFSSNLQFKTASYQIEDVYTEQLDKIASILKSYPELHVNVTGYADARGNADYNKELSTQRAQAVAKYLQDKNVNDAQISVIGAGELAQAKSGNEQNKVSEYEALFFARKVEINLSSNSHNMTAAN